jgi:hypothetical protein
MVKDVFVHDPDSLVTRNVFLMRHGISYHRILHAEMIDSGTTPAPQGGIVNFNGGTTHLQRAIFVRKKTIPFPDVYGLAYTNSINQEPVAIDIDMDEIVAHAAFEVKGTGLKEEADELRDYVVAHEFAHKLALHHTERDIVESANVFIDEYNNGIYAVQFVTPQRTVVWGIFQNLVNPSSGAEETILLERLPLQDDGREFKSPIEHDSDSEIVEPIIVHGGFHSARRVRWTPDPTFASPPCPR